MAKKWSLKPKEEAPKKAAKTKKKKRPSGVESAQFEHVAETLQRSKREAEERKPRIRDRKTNPEHESTEIRIDPPSVPHEPEGEAVEVKPRASRRLPTA